MVRIDLPQVHDPSGSPIAHCVTMIIESSGVGRIVIPEYLPTGFALFYTTRDFPGRLGEESTRSLLAVVRDRFGIDASLTTCTQVHGASVQRAHGQREGRSADGPWWQECDACDALWTTDRDAALGIKVADCLPITMIDPPRHVVANVHSGWRGAVQQILAATIDTLKAGSPFDPAESFAYLGPSIRACCFEVGEEVVSQFNSSYGNVETHVNRSRCKPHIDQPAIAREVLVRRGFRPDRIIDSELCTRCDGSLFHSYRRDGKNGGRNLTVAAQ